MTGWSVLDALLRGDPADADCDMARLLLDIYADLVLVDEAAARLRYPEVAAHIQACGQCADDLEGLLLACRDALS